MDSCSLSPSTVHRQTQARDVGQLLTKAPEYEILSIRGADLFPQTQ